MTLFPMLMDKHMNQVSGIVSTKLKYVAAGLFVWDKSILFRNAATGLFLASLVYGAYMFFHGFIFKYPLENYPED